MPDASRPAARSRTPSRLFPVTHSLLAPDALGRHVQAAYAVGEVRGCTLLQHNLNDTYVVDATTGRYILRASRAERAAGNSGRTREAILFESDLLRHLSRKGVPVAAPLARRNGAFVSAVRAPEGVRHLALFTYAPGEPVTPPMQTEPLARAYGRAVAALHAAAADFASAHPRFALDLDVLLARPLAIVEPYLAHRPDDWHSLRALGTAAAERMTKLEARGLDRGVCHGDAQGGNAHVTPEGTITFFDFDVCGYGWRAYDIAVFYWGAALGRTRLGWDARTVERLCTAYLSGYLERRPLGPTDQEAIAPCVLLRQFWYLGLEAGNWDTWGIGDAQREAFFDRELRFIREWAAEHQLAG